MEHNCYNCKYNTEQNQCIKLIYQSPDSKEPIFQWLLAAPTVDKNYIPVDYIPCPEFMKSL